MYLGLVSLAQENWHLLRIYVQHSCAVGLWKDNLMNSLDTTLFFPEILTIRLCSSSLHHSQDQRLWMSPWTPSCHQTVVTFILTTVCNIVFCDI